MTAAPAKFHAFSKLVLTLSDLSLENVRTDHTFELRAISNGAEVWRSSVLMANGESCESGERFVGVLTTRQVIDLLACIERSGVYEALPACGIADGEATSEGAPLVSMHVESSSEVRTVIDEMRGDADVVDCVVQAVRDAVELAEERALTMAG